MNRDEGVAVGFAGAATTCVAWEAWPGKSAFRLSVLSATGLEGDPTRSPLACVEHHHWGLALLLVKNPVTDGAGLTFIGSETFQSNPFGLGKTQAELTGNVILSSILLGLVLIRRA